MRKIGEVGAVQISKWQIKAHRLLAKADCIHAQALINW